MLHIISQPSPDVALFERTKSDDCLLFIESGLYALVKDSEIGKKINNFSAERKFYALEPDMKLRGLQKNQIIEDVMLIDYPGFVELVVAHPPVLSWR